jgi:hypothetical protein
VRRVVAAFAATAPLHRTLERAGRKNAAASRALLAFLKSQFFGFEDLLRRVVFLRRQRQHHHALAFGQVLEQNFLVIPESDSVAVPSGRGVRLNERHLFGRAEAALLLQALRNVE